MNFTEDCRVERGYRPGAIGRIAELHGTYYHRHWNFGLYFEAKVATELAEFLLRYDQDRDAIWLAVSNRQIEGAVVIDGIHAADSGAHLRWFVVSDKLRGRGLGRQLLQRAVAFCRAKGFGSIYLWTFEGLSAARHLYESMGFELVRQKKGVQWGTEVIEQYFRNELAAGPGGCGDIRA